MNRIPLEEIKTKIRIKHGDIFNIFDKYSLCNMHFHEEIELLYINSGAIKYSTEKESFIARAGDFVFINSKVPHVSEIIESGTSSTLIQFRDPMLHNSSDYLSDFLKNTEVPFYLFKKNHEDTHELSSYFFKMIDEYDNMEFAYEHYLTAVMHMILAFLYRKKLLTSNDIHISNNSNISKIMPAIEFIENNFTSQITLEDLSNLLHLNEQYICRLFKKALNGSFIDYLNFIRICEAEKLLSTQMTLSSIAYKVGFSSLSYFEKVFKKYKLCSPSVYKRIVYKI